MKARVVTKVTISASPVAVFAYLKNLEHHYLWNPALQRLSSIKPLKLGMEYKSVRMVLGKQLKATNTVTAFINNRELQLENNTGMIHYCVNYKLKSQGKNTVLTCSTSVSAESKAFAFAKPVLEILARRELQSDLQALKVAVEQRLQ